MCRVTPWHVINYNQLTPNKKQQNKEKQTFPLDTLQSSHIPCLVHSLRNILKDFLDLKQHGQV